MRKTAVIYKKRGETPLEALTAWKAANPEYAEVPVSYAGRLDPMADGKLLLLIGEECKNQEAYTKLDKEYEVEIVLDLATDTGDVLGMPTYAGVETRLDSRMLAQVLNAEKGKHMRKYPLYSSKTVRGKPLFLHALEGGIDAFDIPEHLEHIYAIEKLDLTRLPLQEFKTQLTELLSKVPRSDEPSKALGADFRQDEIREQWEKTLTLPDRWFALIKLRVTCASGTYMRSLAGRIGEALGTTGIALSITRTRIGTYRAGLWLSEY